MITEDHSNEIFQENKDPNSAMEISVEKNRIDHFKRYKMKLNVQKLNSSLVRRTEVSKLKFEGEREEDEIHGKTDDRILKKLARVIKLADKRRQRLYIVCSWSEEVSNKGLCYICRSIRGFNSLRSLNLDFGGCIQITDRGVSHVCQALKKLGFLRNLSLDFGACSEITDKGIQRLSRVFKKLKSLESISLNFTL